MSKQRYTVSQLEADIDGLEITLSRDDDGNWIAEAEADILGDLGGLPSEEIELVFQDIGYSIESRIADLLSGQLTHYQVAVLMSAMVVDYRGRASFTHTSGIPMTVSGKSIEMLTEIGLVVADGRPNTRRCYGPLGPRNGVQCSGFLLTDWGKKVLVSLAGSKVSEHPKVKAALATLRMTPEGVEAA